MSLSAGNVFKQRIRLRRSKPLNPHQSNQTFNSSFTGGPNPQVVQKNIEHLKIHSAKKLVAQALYYGTEGQSPLFRNTADQDPQKPSVHERLGVKRQQRVSLLGTNTATIAPKKRDFTKFANHNNNRNFSNLRLNAGGGPRNFRNQKVVRSFSVQNRLQRIRNGLPNNRSNNLQPPFNFQNKQKIRLRRTTSIPSNYRVQVPNNIGFGSFRHSIRKQLNPTLQNEIKIIQQTHDGTGEQLDIAESLPVVATSKTLNQRFSELA